MASPTGRRRALYQSYVLWCFGLLCYVRMVSGCIYRDRSGRSCRQIREKGALHDSIWDQIGREGAIYGVTRFIHSNCSLSSSAYLSGVAVFLSLVSKVVGAEPAGLSLGHKRGIERQRSSGDGSCLLSFLLFLSFLALSCLQLCQCGHAEMEILH